MLVPSFDRFRRGLKNTWKDQPSPGVGHAYDLGTHLMDQALALFGRPDKITAFIQNSRGVGHPEVDDSVCFLSYLANAHYLTDNTTVHHPFALRVRRQASAAGNGDRKSTAALCSHTAAALCCPRNQRLVC